MAEQKTRYQKSVLTNAQEKYLLAEIRNTRTRHSLTTIGIKPTDVVKAEKTLRDWQAKESKREFAAYQQRRAMEKEACRAVLFAPSVAAAQMAVSTYVEKLKKHGWLAT